jgi:RNA polymerase sigma factor (TIGR02999 family)
MAGNCTCPACAAATTLAVDDRNNNTCCPLCGLSLGNSGAGSTTGEGQSWLSCEGANGGDPHAAAQLLPLVYDELRKLAAQRLAREGSGQTLQATALVHEAYLRLVAARPAFHWNGRGHFFAAAAQAMRRILVESARRKRRLKRGGGATREEFDESNLVAPDVPEDLVALDEALAQLAADDVQAAELVNLRYFAGLTIPQAAEILGVSPRTANFLWAYARAWLLRKLEA